eukprot:gene22983-biopygen20792
MMSPGPFARRCRQAFPGLVAKDPKRCRLFHWVAQSVVCIGARTSPTGALRTGSAGQPAGNFRSTPKHLLPCPGSQITSAPPWLMAAPARVTHARELQCVWGESLSRARVPHHIKRPPPRRARRLRAKNTDAPSVLVGRVAEPVGG